MVMLLSVDIGVLQQSIKDWREWRTANIEGYARNPLPPRNIIFYRDGVSDGEYAQVVQHEIPLIKGQVDL